MNISRYDGESIHIGRYIGTDELYVEFYSCPNCGFERVPHHRKLGEKDSHLITARYCPGCGVPIKWVGFDKV